MTGLAPRLLLSPTNDNNDLMALMLASFVSAVVWSCQTEPFSLGSQIINSSFFVFVFKKKYFLSSHLKESRSGSGFHSLARSEPLCPCCPVALWLSSLCPSKSGACLHSALRVLARATPTMLPTHHTAFYMLLNSGKGEGESWSCSFFFYIFNFILTLPCVCMHFSADWHSVMRCRFTFTLTL